VRARVRPHGLLGDLRGSLHTRGGPHFSAVVRFGARPLTGLRVGADIDILTAGLQAAIRFTLDGPRPQGAALDPVAENPAQFTIQIADRKRFGDEVRVHVQGAVVYDGVARVARHKEDPQIGP
jgi:hypothetical protein